MIPPEYGTDPVEGLAMWMQDTASDLSLASSDLHSIRTTIWSILTAAQKNQVRSGVVSRLDAVTAEIALIRAEVLAIPGA